MKNGNSPLLSLLPDADQKITADLSVAAHVPRDFALLVIDVQRKYVRPCPELERKSRRIVSLLPQFRAAGVGIYVVHFTRDDEAGACDPAKIDFHNFSPAPGDAVVRKDDVSVFKGSKIDDLLQAHGRKHLLLCGFFMRHCVRAAALDAPARYRVSMLDDMVDNEDDLENICRGNDDENLRAREELGEVYRKTRQELTQKNIEIVQSGDMLTRIKAPSSPPCAGIR